MVSHLLDHRIADMLSGYCVFSRCFVKAFPAMSRRGRIPHLV